MTNKQTGILAIVSAAVLLIIGSVLTFIAFNTKLKTAFDYVKSKGATPTALGGLTFNGYTFYTNNRALRISDGKKGNYTKEAIKFDDGTIVLLSDIFK